MIADNIKNAATYFSSHKHFQFALEYLQRTDFSQLANGKYELDGENAFAIVNRYDTHNADELKWEAHRKYIDIQFLASGFEQVGIEQIERFIPATEYDDAKDVQFFSGGGNSFKLNEKEFVIIFPHEVHKPGILLNEKTSVTKVVIKVKV